MYGKQERSTEGSKILSMKKKQSFAEERLGSGILVGQYDVFTASAGWPVDPVHRPARQKGRAELLARLAAQPATKPSAMAGH